MRPPTRPLRRTGMSRLPSGLLGLRRSAGSCCAMRDAARSAAFLFEGRGVAGAQEGFQGLVRIPIMLAGSEGTNQGSTPKARRFVRLREYGRNPCIPDAPNRLARYPTKPQPLMVERRSQAGDARKNFPTAQMP